MEPDSPRERERSSFRLEWPADAIVEPFEPREEPAEPAAAPPAQEPERPPTPAPPVMPPVPRFAPAPPPVSMGPAIGLGDDVAALAAVSARLDALSSATITFRNALAGQVTEYTQRVSDAIAEQSAGLELALRGQHRAIGELTGQLHSVAGRLGEVTTSVDDLVQVVEEFRSDVAASLESIAEEVRTLRRRTPVRPRAERDDDQLDTVTGAVAETRTAKGRAAPARRRPRQA